MSLFCPFISGNCREGKCAIYSGVNGKCSLNKQHEEKNLNLIRKLAVDTTKSINLVQTSMSEASARYRVKTVDIQVDG